jgi:hypothetical protein
MIVRGGVLPGQADLQESFPTTTALRFQAHSRHTLPHRLGGPADVAAVVVEMMRIAALAGAICDIVGGPPLVA